MVFLLCHDGDDDDLLWMSLVTLFSETQLLRNPLQDDELSESPYSHHEVTLKHVTLK
jgi:hypothetical protein